MTTNDPGRRPRVLLPVTYGFSVRYLLPTGILDALGRFCSPVVGLGWDDDELSALLRERGIEVQRLPDVHLTHGYRMFRRRIAVLHERRLGSPTSRIQRAQRLSTFPFPRSWAIAVARRWLDALAVSVPGGAAKVEAAERSQIERGTNLSELQAFLERSQVDAVVSVTPYHDQDALLLLAAARRGTPTLTSVISFDNPTTRERLVARSDRTLVWNRFNAAELTRAYADLDPASVEVVGAPQFDLHRRPDLIVDEATWRDRLGLPTGRPVILYGAGPSTLVPGEAGLVELIDRAIDEARVPGSPFLLVRRHPTDPAEPWSALGRRLRHGVVADPWAEGANPSRGWPTDDDLVMSNASLAHSAVHVNVCSSMTVDGSVFDRPQIGPSFVPGATWRQRRTLRSFYRQEHWQPIARSGGLTVVDDEAALVTAIAEALARPESGREGRTRLVKEVLTFDDGRSSERLVAAVERFLAAQS